MENPRLVKVDDGDVGSGAGLQRAGIQAEDRGRAGGQSIDQPHQRHFAAVIEPQRRCRQCFEADRPVRGIREGQALGVDVLGS